MDRRRHPKRPEYGGKSKNYHISPKNPQKKQIEKLMELYQMDEAAALEIINGKCSLEIWLQREGKEDLINQAIIAKVPVFSNEAAFSPKAAVEILEAVYEQNDYAAAKAIQESHTREIAKIAARHDLPLQVASKIVKGKQTVEEYLQNEEQQNLRKQKALEIHQKYPEISLNNCYQIIDEGCSTEEYLERRKKRRERREKWYESFIEDRQEENQLLANYLQKLRNKKIKVMFSFFRKNPVMGSVVSYTPYSIKIRVKGMVHKYSKLEIKYFTRALYAERFLPDLEIERGLQRSVIEPSPTPEDRYEIPESVLDVGKQIRLVLGGGEIFQGIVDWFSRYEIKLLLPTQLKSSVVIFRHAVVAASVV